MEEKNLWQYFVECVTKNYFNFKGRARRKEYCGFLLYSVIIFLSLLILGSLYKVFSIIGIIFLISIIPPFISVSVRRYHDRGLSGIFLPLCIFLIPLSNLISEDGVPYTNKYGEDPKGRSEKDPFE